MDKNYLDKMTLDEKCSFLSGADQWHTKKVSSIKLDSIMMTDGPNGVRKEIKGENGLICNSYPATCLPCNVLLGATFSKEAAYLYGKTLGREAKANQVSMILGPGINIKRSPLCGRNFEYLSEDPYLSGLLASKYINGVQEQNIGCSLKHFACNNQETYRSSINEVVDERTLREIYLKGFEIAVKNSQPMSIMTSYNRINGTFSSENKWLLTDVCRNEWGFNGFFVSDWGGCAHKDLAVKAGESLEMPYSGEARIDSLKKAVIDKRVSIDEINFCVDKLKNAVEYGLSNLDKTYKCDLNENHNIAVEIASEGIVLLKNDDNILPLNKKEHVLFAGDFLNFDRIQGGGSSHVNSNNIVSIKQAVKKYNNIEFCSGFDCNHAEKNAILLEEAKSKAKEADKIVLFVGLSDEEESEGYDRKTLEINKVQRDFISEMSRVNSNIVVVLINGSPVLMPFKNKVKGIIESYLGGEGYGEAISNILFGITNPSGCLAETFPLSMKEVPCNKFYPGGSESCQYREGLFVGYRYYSTFDKDVLFPFGYGLSYSNFEYKSTSIRVGKEAISVSTKIKNLGPFDGKIVCQVYVGGPNKSLIFKARKELKDFEKIDLKINEEKQIHFDIPFENLRVFNVNKNEWDLESGEYIVYVGGNSANCVYKQSVIIKSKDTDVLSYDPNGFGKYFNGEIQKINKKNFELLYGKKLPNNNMPHHYHLTDNASFKTSRFTIIGGLIYRQLKKNPELKKDKMMLESVLTLPFRHLFLFASDSITEQQKNGFMQAINGKLSKQNIKYVKEVITILSSII